MTTRRRGEVSLERALSKLGAASRTTARELVVSGHVRVDGRVVTNPAQPVVPETARITIDGQDVRRGAWRMIALHKPRGTITTRSDPENRPTVFDLLDDKGRGLVAVGRLDFASSGLLLFTNDTQLAHRLTDPAREVTRRYLVTVRGLVEDSTARDIERGFDLAAPGGGRERLHASRVLVRKASGRETHLTVDLTEGKNREVRRLFDAVGHEVTALHRVSFGPIELGTLAPGSWREVSRAELAPLERSNLVRAKG